MSNPNPIANGPAASPATTDAVRRIGRADAAPPVQSAIANAARQTSVEFDYLLAQAEVESAMNPNAKAPTSSATGLYQFIESTWLSTMKRHGPRFGLGDIASRIGTNRSGAAHVADSGQRKAILELRKDPQVASLMAAGLAEDNRSHLMPILGRQPDHGELYLAHFLGAGGAGRFLSELSQDPGQSAPDLFRRPAAANRNIFYQRDGSPRSLSGVMDVINGKMRRALAKADDSGIGGTSHTSIAPQPYIVADAAPFESRVSPAIMAASPARFAARPTLTSASLPPISATSARPVSMSNLLRASFGESESQALRSAEGNAQIRRAYDRLKALGL